ncbi:MAG: Em GEA1 (EM1) [Chloroflexi bacterium]|nr:Em GEA1 (EM1) [Chloroflexota bacterium]
MPEDRKDEGKMTVQQAGHKGGEKVSQKYPHEHFEEIGQKGGQKVRELIDKGKQTEGQK